MDKIAEASLLNDFYGQLLTEKQRQVMELYHEENLSLAEIAEEFQISRQAVYDTLKKAEKSLNEYEEKLGLVKKFLSTSQAIEEIEIAVDAMMATQTIGACHQQDGWSGHLQKIKTIIERLKEE
ncbi:MAG: putative DNA-binding protein [Firmicutes bacterium]|nr:putative DNA-binding protein [Bacillota bacterium]